MLLLHTLPAEAFLQPLSERVDLALGFLERVTVLPVVLLVFFCKEKPVTSGKHSPGLCALLGPLTPEHETFVGGQLRGSLGDHLRL